MGLDMFLYRTDKNNKKYEDYQEVGYFRKSNQIHNWFVEKCQDGIDECQSTIVPKEKLEELLNVCQTIITPTKGPLPDVVREALAEDLLPTVGGFFFGSTEYDDYYFSKINDAIKILQEIIDTTNFDTEDIIYHASW
jgi:hypothetical protein